MTNISIYSFTKKGSKPNVIVKNCEKLRLFVNGVVELLVACRLKFGSCLIVSSIIFNSSSIPEPQTMFGLGQHIYAWTCVSGLTWNAFIMKFLVSFLHSVYQLYSPIRYSVRVSKHCAINRRIDWYYRQLLRFSKHSVIAKLHNSYIVWLWLLRSFLVPLLQSYKPNEQYRNDSPHLKNFWKNIACV